MANECGLRQVHSLAMRCSATRRDCEPGEKLPADCLPRISVRRRRPDIVSRSGTPWLVLLPQDPPGRELFSGHPVRSERVARCKNQSPTAKLSAHFTQGARTGRSPKLRGEAPTPHCRLSTPPIMIACQRHCTRKESFDLRRPPPRCRDRLDMTNSRSCDGNRARAGIPKEANSEQPPII